MDAEELQNKCVSIQALTKLDDSAWEAKFDNEQGLYGFVQQEIAKARQQGWHEGRAAVNNPDIQYGYSPDGQTLKESKEE